MRMLLAVLVVVGACGREPTRDDHAAMAAALRSCGSTEDLGCPRPILYVSRLDASIAYYRDRL